MYYNIIKRMNINTPSFIILYQLNGINFNYIFFKKQGLIKTHLHDYR